MGEGARSSPQEGDEENAEERLERLKQVLERFEINIAEANDLVVLADYEIVVIADDSGSMQMGSQPPSERKLGVPPVTRWDELKQTCSLLVELGSCFDESGLDIFFLNRPPVKEVKHFSDPAFVAAFASKPSGTTPLTECLRGVAKEAAGEKPVILFILTDGVPNGGTAPFCAEIQSVVKKGCAGRKVKVQMMACTDDEEAVGWLNDLDAKFTEVDVTDDYYSERAEVLRSGKVASFTRGDWLIKALLGPVSSKFDAWDERGGGAKTGGGGGGGGGAGAPTSAACVLL